MTNIVVVTVPNPMFILPWVHEKFTVKFTMSNVDGCAIYMHIGRLNCPEYTISSYRFLKVVDYRVTLPVCYRSHVLTVIV